MQPDETPSPSGDQVLSRASWSGRTGSSFSFGTVQDPVARLHRVRLGGIVAEAFSPRTASRVEMAVSDRSLGEMAGLLEVIGSEVRLQILRQLREPQRVSQIRVQAGLSRGGERPDRPLSRQAVTHHLEKLIEVGLVKRSPDGGDKRGDAYIVNHGRLFALIDELRQLNLLRPFLEASADPSATLSGDQLAAVRLPDRPRLLEAYGAEDGRAFPLDRSGPSTLGRASGCNILLDHDPYISGEHCTLEASGDGWQVTDLGSSNGTWVNWRKVSPRQPLPLEPGDLLRVGRTHLVLQI